MQNNVREMTDKELLDIIYPQITGTQYGELEYRIKVMRELCEAYRHLCKGPSVNKQREATRRLIAAGIAYRAMKGGSDAQ